MLYLSANNSIVLLIDWQQRLVAAMPEQIESRNRAAVAVLLKAAAELEVPILASEQYPQGLGQTVSELSDLLPEGTVRHPKTVFSAALVPELQEELAMSGRSHVIVVGMEAHVCVFQTVRGLREEGYAVHVPLDGVISRKKHDYMAAVGLMRQLGAVTTSIETVIFDWLRHGQGESFKVISRLIRD